MNEASKIAEVQVSYSCKIPVKDRFKVSSSYDCIDALRKIWPGYEYIEYGYMLLLNRANHVIGYYQLSKGGTTSTIMDIKVISQIAVITNSQSIILAHNHPSGNLKASDNDRKLNEKVKAALKLFDITLLDHIILTEDSYTSMADEGLV
jgi:DNA repair protein RadC